jgi:outer membrane protein OmpA-like peptidoglycan-associated protein
MNARKMDTHAIVSAAREATQMAEDARTIAVKRRDEERHSQEIKQLQDQSELRRKAEAQEAEAVRAEAQAQAQAQEAEAERARAAAAVAAQQAVPRSQTIAPRQTVAVSVAPNLEAGQKRFRSQLYAQLTNTLTTHDTPRGLVVMVSDSLFEPANDNLRAEARGRLANVATVLASHPGLIVRVEGYADTRELSEERAHAVRAALIAGGASPNAMLASGYGASRPIASNATAAGREQNRRVEVVIYGDSIGKTALWDHPFPLRSQR